jgi:hypothetical protein
MPDRRQKITFAEMRETVCAGCLSIAPTAIVERRVHPFPTWGTSY